MTSESQSRRQYISPIEVSPEKPAIEDAFSKLHGEFYRLSERLAGLPSEQIETRLELLRTLNGFEDIENISEALDRIYSIMEDEYREYCEDRSHDFRSSLELAESVLVALVGEDPKEFTKEFQKKKKEIRDEEEWSKMTDEQRLCVGLIRKVDKFIEEMETDRKRREMETEKHEILKKK